LHTHYDSRKVDVFGTSNDWSDGVTFGGLPKREGEDGESGKNVEEWSGLRYVLAILNDLHYLLLATIDINESQTFIPHHEILSLTHTIPSSIHL
jgi:hypothetical protein